MVTIKNSRNERVEVDHATAISAEIAVHRNLQHDGTFGEHYTITHTPTGYALHTCYGVQQAIEIAQQITKTVPHLDKFSSLEEWNSLEAKSEVIEAIRQCVT